MFDDDTPNKPKSSGLDSLDLDTWSIEELEKRISDLNSEIDRVKAAIISKKAGLNAANALFGNHKQ